MGLKCSLELLDGGGYCASCSLFDSRFVVGVGSDPTWAVRSLGHALEAVAVRWRSVHPLQSSQLTRIALQMQRFAEPELEHDCCTLEWGLGLSSGSSGGG